MDLRDFLYFERKSVKEFSKELMISRTYLSQIVHGKVFPSPRLAKDIEIATGGKVKAKELLKEKK